MAERKINPALKQALDLGPPLLFFAAYLWMRDRTYVVGGTEYDGFIVAAAVFVPILVASTAALWALTGKLARMQVVTLVLVILFGGLTVWFNDERFFKMKTTLAYGLMAGILAIGLLQGRSFLAWAMGDLLPMEEAGWMILTRRLTAAFAVLAVANEILWRTFSTDVWVTVETFVFPAALFLFLWSQIVALQPYLKDTSSHD